MDLEKLQELLEEKKRSEVKKLLSEMNEYDIASLIEDLPEDELIQVFRLLPKDIATDVFVNMDDEVQRNLISSLTKEEAKTIIEDMFTDDAADLFEEMPAVMVTRLLSNVDKDTRADINKLLKYKENSAGSLMAMEYIHLKKDLTIEQSIARIRKQQEDFVSYDSCFITDKERKLLGYVTVKDLIINEPDTMINDIMQECDHVLTTAMDQEEVANIFQDYDYSTLPVVDSENRLVGIITVDDIVDILQEEATEDIEKMAAILPSEKPYLRTGVWETYKSRIPWLLFLMISATFTGMILSSYEEALAIVPALTAFIPMLMDTGGNAGSQASVSVIRALSLKDVEFKDIGKVVAKEALVAVCIGTTLAVANLIRLCIMYGYDHKQLMVTFTVCVTLALVVIIAKVIGCTLPILANQLGFDPAVMASPLITTLVDAVSLSIYFAIASQVFHFK